MKGSQAAGGIEAMPQAGEANGDTQAAPRLAPSLRATSRGIVALPRAMRRALMLLWWLGSGRFGWAANFLLPYYRRYVPLRVKERIPLPLRAAAKRRLRKAPAEAGEITASWKVPVEQAKALYLKRCELSVFRLRTEGPIRIPREERPYFSVIISAYDNFRYTIRVLELLEHAAYYTKAKTGVGIEVVVVDNGSSDETLRLGECVSGIVLRRVSPNIGFPRACNLGASLASGAYLVFLNNDVEFEPDVFVRLYETVERDKAQIACFGGAILQFDGSIQDLGSGLWRGGVAQGYFRDRAPDRFAFAYPRDVDYIAGCFFCISAADFRDLGGFDGRYSPGYYEETDLCLRLWKSGKRTRVYPDIRIYHFEFGTFSAGTKKRAPAQLMERHRALFAEQHHDALESRPLYAANTGYPVAYRGVRPRLLFIEDQVPSLRLGSGFGRSELIIRALLEVADIEIFACFDDNIHLNPEDFRYIDITYGPDPEVLEGLLSSRHYDAVYVCRPQNIARFEGPLRAWKAGGGKIVFDTEAIIALRETAQAEHAESCAAITASARFRALVEKELRPADIADACVVINDLEAEIVRQRFHRPVYTIGHYLAARPVGGGPTARSGLLFVGALAENRAPNYESLLWFLDSAWPRIRAAQPAASLRIAGFVGAGVSLEPLRREGVTCLGPIADLTGEYARARAFVAPTRFAAGLPFKVQEAFSYGLPVIASRLIADQLFYAGGGADTLLAATVNDGGAAFAEACLKLLSDDALWSRQREAALAYLRESCAPALLSARVGALIDDLGNAFGPSASPTAALTH